MIVPGSFSGVAKEQPGFLELGFEMPRLASRGDGAADFGNHKGWYITNTTDGCCRRWDRFAFIHQISVMQRRSFMTLASYLGLGAMSAGLAGRARAESLPAQLADMDAETRKTADEFILYLHKRGYQSVAALPLVTGHPFNGGLQYDDSEIPKPLHYVVQPASRIEDVSHRSKPGALPLFHVIGGSKARKEIGEPLDLMLAYLINVVGLDRQRLRLTGTEKAKPLFPILAHYGVEESQFRLVDWQEARLKGEGSGYFEPKEHPRSPSFDTVSIEYILPDSSELEIAEVAFLAPLTGFSVGVERVTMARQNKLMRWDDSLPGFRRAVEQDARRQGRALPAGYYDILGLPRPS